MSRVRLELSVSNAAETVGASSRRFSAEPNAQRPGCSSTSDRP